jgi:pantetheine-phosphate adenylyltransferase
VTTIAVYPGSFDPLTNGHLDIIERGSRLFDKLIVAIAHNTRKQSLFTVEERLKMIRQVVADLPGVEVDNFEGLTVSYAASRGAKVVLRGLRAVADFEYELQMANMNRKLSCDVDTMFMMTSDKCFFVSSQNVKEVAIHGGDVSGLVPEAVCEMIGKKLDR